MIFRRVGRRRRQEAAEPGKLAPADEKEALQAMVAHVWEITRWHAGRGENRDRLAAEIIAFAGVLIALMPQLDEPITAIRSIGWQRLLSATALASAVSLVLAVLIALVSVAKPIRERPAQTSWPKERWKEYRDEPVPAARVLEDQLDALVGDPGGPAPYKELAEAADRREALTRRAVLFMATGVVGLGVVLTGLLLTA